MVFSLVANAEAGGEKGQSGCRARVGWGRDEQVLVLVALGEPAERVDALLPIELERVRVLIVDVVLLQSNILVETSPGRRGKED